LVTGAIPVAAVAEMSSVEVDDVAASDGGVSADNGDVISKAEEIGLRFSNPGFACLFRVNEPLLPKINLKMHALAYLLAFLALIGTLLDAAAVNTTGVDTETEGPDEPIPTEPVKPLTRKILGGSSRMDILAAEQLNRALLITKHGQDCELAYELCRWNVQFRSANSFFGLGANVFTFTAATAAMTAVQLAIPFTPVAFFTLIQPLLGVAVTGAVFTAGDVVGIWRNRKRLNMTQNIYHDEAKKRFPNQTLMAIKAIQFRTYNGEIQTVNQLANLFNATKYEADWIRQRIVVNNITAKN
jgi:hypothetical protein